MHNNESKEKIVKRALFFMLKLAWQQKPFIYLVYGIMLFCEVVQRLLPIIISKLLIDELVLLGKGELFSEHKQQIIMYVALLIGVQLTIKLILEVLYRLREIYRQWFDLYLQTELANQSMEMDFEHTEDPKALDQVNRAKEGISWYSGGVVGILDRLFSIVMNVAVLLGVGALIIITCPLLLPIQCISLLLMLYYNSKNNKIELESFKKLAKSNRLFSYWFFQLSDMRYGKDIRLYESAKMLDEKAFSYAKNQTNVWAETARSQRTNNYKMNLVNAARDGLSYFYIGFMAILGQISIGDFSMCVMSASTLYNNLQQISWGVQEIGKRSNYAYEYIKFLEYPERMEKGTKNVIQGNHVIEFHHVSFRYPRTEKYVLRDINITIHSGEHLSIVGLNGAGKTTFIKLLCRLYDVSEGKILIDGINIKEYNHEEYRKLFAVIFQDFRLFAFSLKDNIVLDQKVNEEKLEHVLKLSNLYEDAMNLVDGLDTTIYKSFDEHGTELSGGQKQKTAICRALYKDAPIVILDEPTAALDPVAEYEIYRQFNQLVGGKTAIYISHRLSSCKFCDRIAVFAEDTIKEYGTHEELVKKENGIYAKMFAAQAQYYVDKVS